MKSKEFKDSAKYLNVGIMLILIGAGILAAARLYETVKSIIYFSGTPSAEIADEMYKDIIAFIEYAAVAFICLFSSQIMKSFRNNDTPFIQDIPKKILAIAATMPIAFLVSNIADFLFPVVTHITPTDYTNFFMNGTNMIIASFLAMLSYIFDYGCKLQQESDETL